MIILKFPMSKYSPPQISNIVKGLRDQSGDLVCAIPDDWSIRQLEDEYAVKELTIIRDMINAFLKDVDE